jgi:hypothetical protein
MSGTPVLNAACRIRWFLTARCACRLERLAAGVVSPEVIAAGKVAFVSEAAIAETGGSAGDPKSLGNNRKRDALLVPLHIRFLHIPPEQRDGGGLTSVWQPDGGSQRAHA